MQKTLTAAAPIIEGGPADGMRRRRRHSMGSSEAVEGSKDLSRKEIGEEVSQKVGRLSRTHFTQDNTYPETPTGSPKTRAAQVPCDIGDSITPLTPRPSSEWRETPSTPGTPRSGKRFKFVNLSSKRTESILDSKSSRESVFFGFYTLFWVVMGCLVSRQMVLNFLDKKEVIGKNILNILRRDLLKIFLTDIAMYLATYEAYFLQALVRHGYVDWNRSGWILQHIWQTGYLFFFLWFSDYMEFPWIGRVFLLLHSLVCIMKQHSYTFYNGYFWNIMKRLERARELLVLAQEEECDDSVIQELTEEIDFCVDEVNAQSSAIAFPDNITLRNYFQYSMFPTLVYQIEYPRTSHFRLGYFLKKTAATFGTYWCMIFVAEEFLYPAAMCAMDLRDRPLIVKAKAYPLVVLDLIPPFVVMYLLVFYIIWDAILNGLAELTYFGDREFYGEWWNSVTWDQFAKDWNVPVHRFLLRHVYHSSMSALHVSKQGATILTFLISSLIHELVMFAIFRKVRGYLFLLQMSQIPLVMLSRTKYLRGKKVLGNVVFWVGICTGPSVMCSLYLTF